jgi:hypothetical protein
MTLTYDDLMPYSDSIPRISSPWHNNVRRTEEARLAVLERLGLSNAGFDDPEGRLENFLIVLRDALKRSNLLGLHSGDPPALRPIDVD